MFAKKHKWLYSSLKQIVIRHGHDNHSDVLGVTQTHKREVWRIVAQESGEDGLPLHTLLLLKHVAIHEAIHHGGVSMDVNVELQTHFL